MKSSRRPYFKGQKSSCPRGCFYPDAVRLYDDDVRKIRVLFCKRHGTFTSKKHYVHYEDVSENSKMLPTDEWRKAIINKLHSDKKHV